MASVPSTWHCPKRRGTFSFASQEFVPTIVAEALEEIRDPLATVLRLGPAQPADHLARAIAGSLAPLEADLPAPAWLRPEQIPPFRRAAAAIDRYGGALLADPVGSGKTWIALALAGALARGTRVIALVPAALRGQWRDTAAQVGIPLMIVSHQAASRGRLPPEGPAMVLIDESHHFRNPDTLRYRHVAPWVVGATVLLVSATPVVNRLEDLAHQLLLGVRDDCLAGRGCPSLLTSLSRGEAPPALGDLVFCRPVPSATPRGDTTVLRQPLPATGRELLDGIDALSLSRERSIAGLIRFVLWRSLASSPAALAGALRRYERLMHHAAQAAACGQALTRAAIRAFTGPGQEQLVLWEMLADTGAPVDLTLDDERPLAELLRAATEVARSPDDKSERLRDLLADATPTIVFTSFRDTLTSLRSRLADCRPAWIRGDRAGIGPSALDRETVLSWFRPGSGFVSHPGVDPPTILLATDVAAEGLNLQAVGRVVHYDLPWTSVRIDQRNGRALRLGTKWADIAIVEFHPPPELERRLGQLDRLLRKRRLASGAGIAPDGQWLYRWRSDLAAWGSSVPRTSGMTVVPGHEPGWLVGLALDLVADDGVTTPMPASLLFIGEDGSVIDAPAPLTRLLAEVATHASRVPSEAERRQALAALMPVVRGRLHLAASALWRAPRRTPEQRLLERRLRGLARRAVQRRDRAAMTRIDTLHAWLAGGLTAGEAILIGRAVSLGNEPQLGLLDRLATRRRRRETAVPRLTGVVRVASFRSCTPSGRFSSTSTEP